MSGGVRHYRCMPAAFSSRLESVFGVRIDQVEVNHIHGLVTNGVSEEFDLDFKRDLYGRSDAAKRELAGDVAALANTAGGVILIGVDEDDHARASAAPGVDVSDDERARMLQVVAAGVAPDATTRHPSDRRPGIEGGAGGVLHHCGVPLDAGTARSDRERWIPIPGAQWCDDEVFE